MTHSGVNLILTGYSGFVPRWFLCPWAPSVPWGCGYPGRRWGRGGGTFSVANRGTQQGKETGPIWLERQAAVRGPEERVKVRFGPYSEKLQIRVPPPGVSILSCRQPGPSVAEYCDSSLLGTHPFSE